MRACCARSAWTAQGAPDLRDLPVPTPEAGQVLIKVEAFGLNRSELHTPPPACRGRDVPRVLGIEADRYRGGLSGRGAWLRASSRRNDGRHGPHLPRWLRRVHLCASRPDHRVHERSRLGCPRRRPRDAADLLRHADRRPRRPIRAVDPDPRRHIFDWHDHCRARQAARHDAVLSTTRNPNAPTSSGASASTTRLSTTATSPPRSADLPDGVDTALEPRRHSHLARHTRATKWFTVSCVSPECSRTNGPNPVDGVGWLGGVP